MATDAESVFRQVVADGLAKPITPADTVDYKKQQNAVVRRSRAATQRIVDVAEHENKSKLNVMTQVEGITSAAGELDANDPITADALALVLATKQAIMSLLPRDDDPTSVDHWNNPFNVDTKAAAEARLTAFHQIEQSARNIGRIAAMRELERGRMTQHQVAALLEVAPMTVNRMYRKYRDSQSEEQAES